MPNDPADARGTGIAATVTPAPRFDSAKSTSRYRPPNGTADFALSSVRGASRLPAAPARTMPRTRRFANLPHLPPAGKP
jgi:hypothetical protein